MEQEQEQAEDVPAAGLVKLTSPPSIDGCPSPMFRRAIRISDLYLLSDRCLYDYFRRVRGETPNDKFAEKGPVDFPVDPGICRISIWRHGRDFTLSTEVKYLVKDPVLPFRISFAVDTEGI